MQRIGGIVLLLAIALVLLFAMEISGFAQATVPGSTTNPGTSMPAQNPGGVYQPGLGTTTPNSIPEQLPSTNNQNPNVTPNSTLPNQNPNAVPNPYPNTVPTVPYPGRDSNLNPNATNPNSNTNVTPGTLPNNSTGTSTPYRPGAPTGSGAVGSGVPIR